MSKSWYAVAALGITLILTSVILAGGTNGGAVRDTIWPSVALEVGAGILLGVVFVWLERRIETRVTGRLDPLEERLSSLESGTTYESLGERVDRARRGEEEAWREAVENLKVRARFEDFVTVLRGLEFHSPVSGLVASTDPLNQDAMRIELSVARPDWFGQPRPTISAVTLSIWIPGRLEAAVDEDAAEVEWITPQLGPLVRPAGWATTQDWNGEPLDSFIIELERAIGSRIDLADLMEAWVDALHTVLEDRQLPAGTGVIEVLSHDMYLRGSGSVTATLGSRLNAVTVEPYAEYTGGEVFDKALADLRRAFFEPPPPELSRTQWRSVVARLAKTAHGSPV